MTTNQTNPKTNASLEPGREIKAIFEVSQGGQKQTLMIRKDRVVIGSVESADVKLYGAKIAPIHAVMEITFGESESKSSAKILDLASPTGVFVNGSKVINQIVRSGDKMRVGDAQITFYLRKPEFQTPLPDQALLLIEENQVRPIFDYRPPVKEAMEAVYSWHDSILNVKHFVDKDQIVLGGGAEDDFLIPSGNSQTLATKAGNQWVIYLDAKMKGVLYLGGELYSVEEYRSTKIENDPRGAVALGENDFAKIEVGNLSFYLSQTVAPPLLKKEGRLVADPFLVKSFVASIFITALMFLAAEKFDTSGNETVQVPETVATILYHPEKYSLKKIPPPPKKEEKKAEAKAPEPPKKAEVDFTKKPPEKKVTETKSAQPGKKQTAQNAAKEGEGAKAKGAAGSRGEKNAKNTGKPQTIAKRASPEAGNDRGGTRSEVADNGNVQMMKGATNKILDLLGGSGEKLGKGGSKLQGFGGFSTQGNGGNAMAGAGKGGGGTADTLLGGLGDKGRGGGKVGTGLGAEGTGSGIVGGKTRVELNAGGGDETVVVGAIDRDAIDAAIRAHRDEFRYCYEREVNSGHPNLSGKIVTAFVIGGSGRGSQMAIASSSMNSPNVERCVLGVIGRIQFPQPAGGVPVTIKYPFAYSNSSK